MDWYDDKVGVLLTFLTKQLEWTFFLSCLFFTWALTWLCALVKTYSVEHKWFICSRARLKRDGTCTETRYGLSAKRTSPFKSAGGSVQSTTGSRGVRISSSNGSNAGYTMFWGTVQDYWLPTPLACFPFTSSTVRYRVPSGFNWALLLHSIPYGRKVTESILKKKSLNKKPCRRIICRRVKIFWMISSVNNRKLVNAILYADDQKMIYKQWHTTWTL